MPGGRSARETDQDPTRDDEAGADDEAPAEAFDVAEEQRRQPNPPERLCGDKQRADTTPAAEERLVERDVGEPEQQACGHEGRPRRERRAAAGDGGGDEERRTPGTATV